jgi:hypothetical protein
MPAKSPEAIAKKKANHNAKRRKKTEHVRLSLQKSDLPCYKIAAPRMRPKLPPMTKAELREMLHNAVRNT